MFYHCWHDYLWTDPSVERYGEQGQPSMSILLHSWQDLQVHSYGFDTESCLRTIPWSSSMSMGRPSLQSIPCSSTLWPRSIEEEFLERSSWLWYPCLPSCSSQSWCLQIPSSFQEYLHVSEVLPSLLHLFLPSSMSSEASLQNVFSSTWFFGFVVSSLWMTYGLLIDNSFIIIPNGLASLISALQLCLFILYRKGKSKPKRVSQWLPKPENTPVHAILPLMSCKQQPTIL